METSAGLTVYPGVTKGIIPGLLDRNYPRLPSSNTSTTTSLTSGVGRGLIKAVSNAEGIDVPRGDDPAACDAACAVSQVVSPALHKPGWLVETASGNEDSPEFNEDCMFETERLSEALVLDLEELTKAAGELPNPEEAQIVDERCDRASKALHAGFRSFAKRLQAEDCESNQSNDAAHIPQNGSSVSVEEDELRSQKVSRPQSSVELGGGSTVVGGDSVLEDSPPDSVVASSSQTGINGIESRVASAVALGAPGVALEASRGGTAVSNSFSPHSAPPLSPSAVQEVEGLQAEVTWQEGQLRGLLTGKRGEDVSEDVLLEVARLRQGLDGIRAVIAGLQEQMAASVQAAASTGSVDPPVQSSERIGAQARRPSADSEGKRRLRGCSAGIDSRGKTTPTPQQRGVRESVSRARERPGAFRGLVRGSGTGGGAASSRPVSVRKGGRVESTGASLTATAGSDRRGTPAAAPAGRISEVTPTNQRPSTTTAAAAVAAAATASPTSRSARPTTPLPGPRRSSPARSSDILGRSTSVRRGSLTGRRLDPQLNKSAGPRSASLLRAQPSPNGKSSSPGRAQRHSVAGVLTSKSATPSTGLEDGACNPEETAMGNSHAPKVGDVVSRVKRVPVDTAQARHMAGIRSAGSSPTPSARQLGCASASLRAKPFSTADGLQAALVSTNIGR